MSQSTTKGRPSRYNATLGAAVCWQIADGKSLREISRKDQMPHRNTVFRWIEANPEFRSQYARAKELQAHAIADETWEIVDGVKDGSIEQIQAARLRYEQRRWMAGKLLPKVYGEKLLHTGPDGEGPISVRLSVDYSLLSPDEMVQLRALLAKATPRKLEAPMIEGDATEDANDVNDDG